MARSRCNWRINFCGQANESIGYEFYDEFSDFFALANCDDGVWERVETDSDPDAHKSYCAEDRIGFEKLKQKV